MKEYIISRLESVQSVMDTLNELKDEHDPLKSFNFYWEYLDFINWLKVNEPNDCELYELEYDFEILDEFGDVYVQVIEPARIKYLYRHDDGILNIDVPLPKMIKQFYDFVINLQESELAAASETIANAKSFKDVMDVLNLISNDVKQVGADVTVISTDVRNAATNVKEIGSVVRNAPVIDPDLIADKFVDRVVNTPKPGKTLNKAEQFQAELANRIAKDDLQYIQKQRKNQK